MTDSDPTPPLTESARSVYDAARALAGAWGGTFASVRRLLVADLALAREALIRGLVLLIVAAVLLGTAWVLLTVLAVWALYNSGVGWGVAIAVPLLISAILGVIAFLQAAKALRLADMDASRRQLSLWFGTQGEARQTASGSPEAAAPPPGADMRKDSQP